MAYLQLSTATGSSPWPGARPVKKEKEGKEKVKGARNTYNTLGYIYIVTR